MTTLLSVLKKKRARRLLFFIFLIAIPIPYFAVGTGFGPTLRLLFLGGIATGFFLSAPAPSSFLFVGLFLGQALLWVAVMRFGTNWIVRRIARQNGKDAYKPGFPPPETCVDARWVYGLSGVPLLLSMLPIYTLPLSKWDAPVGLWGIFG